MRCCRLMELHEVKVKIGAASASLGRTPLWRASRLPQRDFRARRLHTAGATVYEDGIKLQEQYLQLDLMAKRKSQERDQDINDITALIKRARKTQEDDMNEDPDEQTATQKERLVAVVKDLDVETFKQRYVDAGLLHFEPHDKDLTLDISLQDADYLSPGEHNAAFGLIEATSRQDYEASSWGWHPRRKRKEMLEAEMKYLFIRRSGAEASIERRKDGDLDTSVEGFVSFMVTHDSSPVVPVIYIYEIHLAESLRGIRLGQHMMALVESVARNVGVKKVMLTCFLCNDKAHGFYESLGYGKDVSSPESRKTRNRVVKVDYEIMSKDV